jgi:hypothetical protein
VVQASAQFGTAQNDSEGYDGLTWGSSASTNSAAKPVDRRADLERILDKVVGAPGKAERFGQYRGDPNGELLFEVYEAGTPTVEYRFNEQTETYYVYFKDQLASIITRLKGDYVQVKADLDRKYSTGREVEADSWGDGSNEAVASHGSRVEGIFLGKVYRRGSSNTRIYVLEEVVNGFKSDVYLVYIPNAYFSAIRDEWWANYERAQQEEADRRKKQQEQVHQADQQKIQ